jgi:hypothetical protein
MINATSWVRCNDGMDPASHFSKQLGRGLWRRQRANRGHARPCASSRHHHRHGRNAKLIFSAELSFDAVSAGL